MLIKRLDTFVSYVCAIFLSIFSSFQLSDCSLMKSHETATILAIPLSIVTRESYSLEANNALLFYLFVHLFLVPSLLEGASNFCEGAKHMAEGTHAAGYDQKIVVL